MAAVNTSTDYLARHGIEDAKYHLMPAKYAMAIKSNPKSRLALLEAKVRCNAQKRIMHTTIRPTRPVSEGGLMDESKMCAKCLSHWNG